MTTPSDDGSTNGMGPASALADDRRVPVMTLLGHQQARFGTPCLASLLECSVDPIRLVIHDDGTLTQQDRSELSSALPGSLLITREEADDRIDGILRPWPNLRERRRMHPMIVKLLDPILLDSRDALAYCDSDIYFRRPFVGLWSQLVESVGAVFMTDNQSAYSVRSWDLAKSSFQLVAAVNAGVINFRRQAFDVEFVDWFLARAEHWRTPFWIEQTCWAALGARVGCRLIDRSQIVIPTRGVAWRGNPVAYHFVSSIRPSEVPIEPVSARSEVEMIRSYKARPCGPLRLAGTEVGRRVTRTVKRYLR